MKIYFFAEWSSFDSGGMAVEEFESSQELSDWLCKAYPNGIPDTLEYRVIEGHERKILEKKTRIVESYTLD